MALDKARLDIISILPIAALDSRISHYAQVIHIHGSPGLAQLLEHPPSPFMVLLSTTHIQRHGPISSSAGLPVFTSYSTGCHEQWIEPERRLAYFHCSDQMPRLSASSYWRGANVAARLRSEGMLSINIAEMNVGRHEMVVEPAVEEVELDPDVFRDVRVQVRLDRRPDKVFVSFDASAVARLQCDRTLVDFDQPVEGAHEVLFAPPEMADVRNDDDVQPLHPDDEEIDLTRFVRDTLLLAIPQRKVAPGAEDVDIPTRFGSADETEEIDPRWAALRELRDADERDQ